MHIPSIFDICQASTISLVVLSWRWNSVVVWTNNGSHFFVVHRAQCAARCVYGRPLRMNIHSLSLTFMHQLVWPTYRCPHVNGISHTFFLRTKNLYVWRIVHLLALLLALSCRMQKKYCVQNVAYMCVVWWIKIQLLVCAGLGAFFVQSSFFLRSQVAVVSSKSFVQFCMRPRCPVDRTRVGRTCCRTSF